MDDFLAGWDDKTSAQAKRKGAKAKRGKNGNEAIGIKMLEEIRQGLGPARVPGNVSGRA
jgi:protein LTV1